MESQDLETKVSEDIQPKFANLEIYIIFVVFIYMMITLFMEVVSRHLFSVSYAWVEPIGRLGFICLTFAGISLAAGKSMHLRVSLITSLFPEKVGKYFMLFGDTVALLFGLYMAYYIFDNMMFLMEKGSVYTSVRWLKQWVMYLPGVLGLLGFSLRLIETSIYPTLKELFNKK